MKKQNQTGQPPVSEKRFEMGFRIFNRWLSLRQNNKTLLPFFRDNRIGTVAIYGMGALGERLYQELKDSGIFVEYAIDRLASSKERLGFSVYGSEEKSFPQTDAVVITPVQDYWAIVEELETKTDAALVSLEDVVDYCADGEDV
ncbi:MAG: hypothetical protein HFH25_05560 [Lachnospiraceae bacterium]|nr:hypothetical protein [Lachnospiraceae bacterium]